MNASQFAGACIAALALTATSAQIAHGGDGRSTANSRRERFRHDGVLRDGVRR